MREIEVLGLHNEETSTTDDSSAEVDLAKYIHVAGRELSAFLGVHGSSDSTTDIALNYKIQESETTASSDFTDITGATFTANTGDSLPDFEQIYFQASKRYVRGNALISGSTIKVGLVSGVVVVKKATT